jgi:hypothetical protein
MSDRNKENMRENWNQYKDTILPDSKEYKLLWDDWYEKFDIDNKDPYVKTLRRFISHNDLPDKKMIGNYVYVEKHNEFTLIIKGLGGDGRRALHKLCDEIGLHHESKLSPSSKNKRRKFMYIYKPVTWSWEFTEKNPYSESDEYYKQKSIEREERNKVRLEKMSRKNCYECGSNGSEAELFHSVYIRGILCEDCLGNVSDGGGGLLNDHKFEPLRY